MSEKCLFDTNEVRRVSIVRSDSWRKRRAVWQMRRRQYLSMTGKDSARWLALYCVPRYNVFTFRIIEANKMHYFSTLFWYTSLHVSDRLTVHHQGPWYYIHSN